MLEVNIKNEQKNLKALFIGLFLIILIALVTVLKSSNLKEKSPVKENNEPIAEEKFDLSRLKKITSEELARKILHDEDIIIVDLRSENQYIAEHIIGSISLANLRLSNLSQLSDKNKLCILVDEGEDVALIGTISENFLNKGYSNIAYLESGFNSWKKKFNPTISDGNPNSFSDQAKVSYIKNEELKEQMEKKKNLLIIDIRTNAEFSLGHIKDSLNIPLDSMEKKRKEIPFGKKIIVYSDDNNESFKAGVRLFDLGFPETKILSEGLKGWEAKNFEIVK